MKRDKKKSILLSSPACLDAKEKEERGKKGEKKEERGGVKNAVSITGGGNAPEMQAFAH